MNRTTVYMIAEDDESAEEFLARYERKDMAYPTDKVHGELLRMGATTMVLCPNASEAHWVATLKDIVGAFDMRDHPAREDESPELSQLMDGVRNALRAYWTEHHPDDCEEETAVQ